MRKRSNSWIWGQAWALLAGFVFVLCTQTAWGAPVVTANSPADGATNVAVTSNVMATFSEAMDQASITSGSFTLSRFVRIKAIAAGGSHTVALKNDGTVVAWGNNGNGQTTVPAGVAGVTAIAAGAYHTVALKNDGTVVTWGYNYDGSTTVPAGLSGVIAIAAGRHHTVALRNDGTVAAWGYDGFGQIAVPEGLSGVTAIAAGAYHSVALKNDGTVVAWGRNDFDQSMAPAGLSGVTAIAAGDGHTVAVKNDGTIVSWGDDGSGQTTVPAGLSGVIAIAASSYHTVALKNDGTVVAWGSNDFDQSTAPPGLCGVTAIAVGEYHTVTLKNDGTVIAWGYDGSGQTKVPVGLSGVSAIAAGPEHTVALNIDGTVVAWGNNGAGQSTVPAGLANVTAIAAGYHTVALTFDGAVVAWGNNGAGQSTVPAALPIMTAIAAGASHTVALQNDGTVVAWGANGYGQSTVPAGLTNVTGIAAGGDHTLALKSDGTVVAWGDNNAGQRSVPAGLTGVTAIAGGYYHSVALKSDGTVVGWGHSGAGPVPAELSGVTAIAAGGWHTVALKDDGTVVAWGWNEQGQTTVPAGLAGVTAIAAGHYHTVALKSDGTVITWGRGNTVPVSPYETPVTGTVSYDAASFTATYTPDIPLNPSTTYTTYTARVNTGVRSLGSSHPVTETEWSFTTAAPDTTPPVTTASHAGGTYNTNQSVTLTCNDDAGSGCSAINYCLGAGCNPTLTYTGALNITASTDLRVASIDIAGNPESIQTLTYTIDTVPPTAAITCSPAGPYRLGNTVTITAIFSEPMALAAAPRIALNGANTLAATDMTWSDATHYTFDHTIGNGSGPVNVYLSTGTDLAGNLVLAAPTSGGSFTIDKTAQNITFNALPDKANGDPDFDPGAGSDSSLPITYYSSNQSVASIVAGKVHITGAGTTYITATQPGDETYSAAPPVQQALHVEDIPTVVMNAVTNITFTTAKVSGYVALDGNAAVTALGVCWNTTGNPVLGGTDNCISTTTTDKWNFTASLTGLASGTTYFVRAYATNSVGTAYGKEEITFAAAKIITVTSAADNGEAGTLRDAMETANPYDKIVFDPAVTGTITLTKPVAITKPLTLSGPGAANLSISGNNKVRVFLVEKSQFTLKNVTVTGGAATDKEPGGGLYNLYGSVTIDSCIFTGNRASGVYAFGGGIYNEGGALTVTNSTISGNSANGTVYGYGGGIMNSGGKNGLSISNSTIAGNSASTGGGGIYTESGMAVSNSTISGNSVNATSDTHTMGGGIYSTGGSLSVTNSTISGNSVTGGTKGYSGGGIMNEKGDLRITNSTITGNSTSALGGGIASVGLFTITGSTVADSTAVSGGGLYAETADVYNCTFTGNSASESGGGIFGSKVINLTNTILAGNSAPLGPDMKGSVNSMGYNLIQDTTGANFSGDTTGNITGQGPSLGPLADNGGPTKTRALLAGSPAIDAIPNGVNGCDRTIADQRGMIRPQNGACDIGSYERGTPTMVTAGAGDNQSATIFTPFLTVLQAKVADYLGGPLDGISVTFAGPAGWAGIIGGGSAITDAGGTSSFAATANDTAGGPYTVIATIASGLCTHFSLMNSKAPTATLVTTSAPDPLEAGQTASFTATLTSTAGGPTGMVTFRDGSSEISGCINLTLKNGSATCEAASLAVGTHIITAVFSGSDNFSASTSAALIMKVRISAPLAVTMTGTGGGSINSVPSGIACTGGTCSALFDLNSPVTLTAFPDSASTFGKWEGTCSGSSTTCTVTMGGDKQTSVRFDAAPPAMAETIPYQKLQDAFDEVASGGTIRALAIEFRENPVLNRGVHFNLNGGYSGDYESITGWTAIRGTLTIGSGSLEVDQVEIR